MDTQRTTIQVQLLHQFIKTSTYLQDDIGDLRQGYEYSRTANPTRSSVESVIAALENGKHGFAFSSGVAAISAVVMLLDTKVIILF